MSIKDEVLDEVRDCIIDHCLQIGIGQPEYWVVVNDYAKLLLKVGCSSALACEEAKRIANRVKALRSHHELERWDGSISSTMALLAGREVLP